MLSVALVLISITPFAKANLLNPEGKNIGKVIIYKLPSGGTLIDVEVEVPKGWHAFHIHEKGECKSPDFKSAGGHWNPDKKEHGFFSQKGHHKGDLPNFWSNGKAKFQIYTPHIRPEELLGKAFVIHQKPDDYKSQPAGKAGKRIACGVVKREK